MKILEVHVDKGMKHGQKITFGGEADQAPGVEPGDIVLVLQEKENEVGGPIPKTVAMLISHCPLCLGGHVFRTQFCLCHSFMCQLLIISCSYEGHLIPCQLRTPVGHHFTHTFFLRLYCLVHCSNIVHLGFQFA